MNVQVILFGRSSSSELKLALFLFSLEDPSSVISGLRLERFHVSISNHDVFYTINYAPIPPSLALKKLSQVGIKFGGETSSAIMRFWVLGLR